MNFELFEQALEEYKRDYGTISDDLEKMITRVVEDNADVRARFNEKEAELNAYNAIRDEYENMLNNISKTIQMIETRIQQSHGIDLRENLDLLKVRSNSIMIEMHCLFCVRIYRVKCKHIAH